MTDGMIEALFAELSARKDAPVSESYTASLLARGTTRIAQKVGEEAVETIIAAASDHRNEVVSESADLLYHLCALWLSLGITAEAIAAELASRRSRSGLAEKAARKED